MSKKKVDDSSGVGTKKKNKEKSKVKPPRKYKVVLHNDDYTTWEFVISLLMQLFHKDYDTSYSITKGIHDSGRGIAGVYLGNSRN